jgi:hypothetical protein
MIDRSCPFAADADGSAPAFLPIGDRTLVRQTSSTHGSNGYISVDPDEIAAFQLRLKKKLWPMWISLRISTRIWTHRP